MKVITDTDVLEIRAILENLAPSIMFGVWENVH